jgi:hypothetical protein
MDIVTFSIASKYMGKKLNLQLRMLMFYATTLREEGAYVCSRDYSGVTCDQLEEKGQNSH